MGMSHEQIAAHVGKQVVVHGSGDLQMSEDHCMLVGKMCKLLRLTKGGLVLIEFEGKQRTVRPSQIDSA